MFKAVFTLWEGYLDSLILTSKDGQDDVNKKIVDHMFNSYGNELFKFTDEKLAEVSYQQLQDKL